MLAHKHNETLILKNQENNRFPACIFVEHMYIFVFFLFLFFFPFLFLITYFLGVSLKYTECTRISFPSKIQMSSYRDFFWICKNV